MLQANNGPGFQISCNGERPGSAGYSGKEQLVPLTDDLTEVTIRSTKYYKSAGVYYRPFMETDKIVYVVSHV